MTQIHSTGGSIVVTREINENSGLLVIVTREINDSSGLLVVVTGEINDCQAPMLIAFFNNKFAETAPTKRLPKAFLGDTSILQGDKHFLDVAIALFLDLRWRVGVACGLRPGGGCAVCGRWRRRNVPGPDFQARR